MSRGREEDEQTKEQMHRGELRAQAPAHAGAGARTDHGRAGKAPSSIVMEDVKPQLDCGRYRPKRCVGDTVEVTATIFRDGHGEIEAIVRFEGPGDSGWQEAPMSRRQPDDGSDRWSGSFEVQALGRCRWQILAWTNRFSTWQQELERKISAGERDLESELAEGILLIREAAAKASGVYEEVLAHALSILCEHAAEREVRWQVALDRRLATVCSLYDPRTDLTESALLEIDVERERARFGAWYELFPRSWGGFRGVQEILPKLADLGFDVLYLPPIHPIGHTKRRGRNDTEPAREGDPGSPWAIGSEQGGHTAVHEELGTLQDFDALLRAARAHGIEIALDFAIQCSVDHPWLTEHPEWFAHRPDGTLKYAENPPKRYMDICNLNFESSEWRSLWLALRDVMLFWVDRGVRIFRVDNPHTKPLPFWAWLLESVRSVAPETIFLSEAFTRAPMMHALAKVGFSQSYTYFTWKNSAFELRQYISELAGDPSSEYLRPNLFVNTPDILTAYLQHGGRAAFAARLLLAATLSPSYGMYSGFESFEATPRFEGSEEYLDSEKYEVRKRSLDGPLLPMVAKLNAVRREHAALQRFENIDFLAVENDALLAYAKRTEQETLLIVVNVDPDNAQQGIVLVGQELGLPPVFEVEDLLCGERYRWQVGRNYVALDPAQQPGHLLLVSEAR